MPATERLRAALDDRYRIEREIGAGGMATVYLARDLKHDRDVALKVLRPDLSAIIGAERFLAEVRITAQLDHPHILVLIDSGVVDGALYYVLPYVRGESLRGKLTRERQLSLDEALSITRQIASALDYAHRNGVVHRDIKPENILLHEGEAMLADFGIALAVKEAGGNRLTETGLSLGTPQYMSPEQATGDRTLDGRSDVYSLGAVFYEMVAGEPPVTGATAQAIIAKLLTERPTGLRVVRDTVPPAMERATERALAKVPADRFKTAGEFASALDSAIALAAPRTATRPRFVTMLAMAGVALVAIGALATWALRSRNSGPAQSTVMLRDRTQLTTTGRVRIPAISHDGKSLAYVTTNCRASGCTYGIELQDVGGVASRRLYDGATAIYRLSWSSDRRNLLFMGSVDGRFGTFLLSALGGTPRPVSVNHAAFTASGDSLLVIGAEKPAETQWIFVAGLDGIARDSIRVRGPSNSISWVEAVPGSEWIVVHVEGHLRGEWRVIDRQGNERSTLSVPTSDNRVGRASSDALWIANFPPGATREQLVRHPLDRATGRLSGQGDTLYTGLPSDFGVVDDGTALMVDEGTTEYGAWALDVSDAVRGVFPEQGRLARSTTQLHIALSRDGQRVLLSRDIGASPAQGRQYAWLPSKGGAETPVALPSGVTGVNWVDSTHLVFNRLTTSGRQLGLFDIMSGTVSNTIALPDSSINDWEPLANGGWAWVPRRSRTVRILNPGETVPREVTVPDMYLEVSGILSSLDGRSLSYVAWKAPREDSLGFGTISLANGRSTHWLTRFGESSGLSRSTDSSFVALIQETLDTYALYRISGTEKVTRIGGIPRPLVSITLSTDLRRVAVVTRDYHGDAWLHRVVKR